MIFISIFEKTTVMADGDGLMQVTRVAKMPVANVWNGIKVENLK